MMMMMMMMMMLMMTMQRTLLLSAGPTGHYWYHGLDAAVKRFGMASTSLAGVASKVVADSLIFGPVHIVAFFAFMEAVEGGGPRAAAEKIRSEFWPTFMVELGFWPAFQALNFWRIPVRNQLLAVNFAGILDSTFLCWYAPDTVIGGGCDASGDGCNYNYTRITKMTMVVVAMMMRW